MLPHASVTHYATIATHFPETQFTFLVASPLPPLAQAMDASRITGGCNLPALTAIAKSMALALQQIHSCGCVHGDVQPHHVLRVDGIWKLIDMSSAVQAGHAANSNSCGVKGRVQTVQCFGRGFQLNSSPCQSTPHLEG